MAGEVSLGRLRRSVVARRRNPPGSQVAADPIVPLALSDFHDLRRLGLFGDDGRRWRRRWAERPDRIMECGRYRLLSAWTLFPSVTQRKVARGGGVRILTEGCHQSR